MKFDENIENIELCHIAICDVYRLGHTIDQILSSET